MLASLLIIASAAIALADELGLSQFTPFTNNPRSILEGNWQSCREADGQYAERVYDGKFKGVQEAHRDHDSPENLLKPYRVPLDAGRAKQRWEIPSLSLAFTATLAGGSRTDCESWFIILAPMEKTSH